MCGWIYFGIDVLGEGGGLGVIFDRDYMVDIGMFDIRMYSASTRVESRIAILSANTIPEESYLYSYTHILAYSEQACRKKPPSR